MKTILNIISARVCDIVESGSSNVPKSVMRYYHSAMKQFLNIGRRAEKGTILRDIMAWI